MNPAPTSTMAAATNKAKPRAKSVRELVREETRAAYREAILAAAGRVFGRVGFHAAKMADIAAEAGVAAGTLYNYFASKDEIFATMLEEGQQRMLDAVEESLREPDPLLRLHAVVRTIFAFLEQDGPLVAVFLREGGLTELTRRRLFDSDDRAHLRGLQLLRLTLERAADAGLLRLDVDLADQAAALQGILDAIIFDWVRRGSPPGLVDRAPIALDLFLHGTARR
ncbi:MAG: TetR/AcrR family transcriptional regulator [Nannocystis sp.]|nr:TetR/AcrR family transcriptional regulator [Nannocystis sp.]